MANACEFHPIKKDVNTKVDYTDEEAQRHAEKVHAIPRPKETIDEIDERGAFIRQANYFTTPFGEKEGEFKADKDRYVIYVFLDSLLCHLQ